MPGSALPIVVAVGVGVAVGVVVGLTAAVASFIITIIIVVIVAGVKHSNNNYDYKTVIINNNPVRRCVWCISVFSLSVRQYCWGFALWRCASSPARSRKVVLCQAYPSEPQLGGRVVHQPTRAGACAL